MVDDQEMINKSYNNTIRMPSEAAATVKMGETVDTVVMGQNESPSDHNGYIQIGDDLDGKYRIMRNLTYNTGEATLFICEAKGQVVVAKVYHQNMKPKDEVSEKNLFHSFRVCHSCIGSWNRCLVRTVL